LIQEKFSPEIEKITENYTTNNFIQVGQGICESLMDILKKQKESRLPNTPMKTLDNWRLYIAMHLLANMRQDKLLKSLKYRL